MDPFEVKVFMLKNGLTIARMSKELCDTPYYRQREVKPKSMATMISDMVYQRHFYPTLAEKIKAKYKICFERSAQFEPARTVVQKAAK